MLASALVQITKLPTLRLKTLAEWRTSMTLSWNFRRVMTQNVDQTVRASQVANARELRLRVHWYDNQVFCCLMSRRVL
ncbi:hypothetical protein PC116_g28519 [Phytophthora cactorum]|nr:hypothetical protein PC116_g28519 [Phytophthora cactorum]